nr:hypothetical protein [Dermacoccus abyssi]
MQASALHVAAAGEREADLGGGQHHESHDEEPDLVDEADGEGGEEERGEG